MFVCNKLHAMIALKMYFVTMWHFFVFLMFSPWNLSQFINPKWPNWDRLLGYGEIIQSFAEKSHWSRQKWLYNVFLALFAVAWRSARIGWIPWTMWWQACLPRPCPVLLGHRSAFSAPSCPPPVPHSVRYDATSQSVREIKGLYICNKFL